MVKQKSKTIIEGKSNSGIMTLEQILEMDRKLKFEVAQAFDQAGYVANCHYVMVDKKQSDGSEYKQRQQLIGLGSAYDRNAYVVNHLCENFPEDTKHKIIQLMRIKDESGKEKLIVQGITYTRDFVGNEIRHSFTLGRVDRPKFFIGYDGFDSKTGQPLATGKQLNGFNTEYYLGFSEAQVRALEKHFGKIGFIIHTGNRKYTVEDLESFLKSFTDVKAAVEPPKKKAN